ncbi:hypothetical protein KIPB_006539 [Kipferlia bialata]|uniref:Uncharacterized protein n=1 Tax=Kipferlia bialata TaxID=797122 RepID=A0A391NMF8_9EUKA|nr:hypothetical protein KIPB_006539 [Kipferlia bialata]|eukprot:g6539.t1
MSDQAELVEVQEHRPDASLVWMSGPLGGDNLCVPLPCRGVFVWAGFSRGPASIVTPLPGGGISVEEVGLPPITPRMNTACVCGPVRGAVYVCGTHVVSAYALDTGEWHTVWDSGSREDSTLECVCVLDGVLYAVDRVGERESVLIAFDLETPQDGWAVVSPLPDTTFAGYPMFMCVTGYTAYLFYTGARYKHCVMSYTVRGGWGYHWYYQRGSAHHTAPTGS